MGERINVFIRAHKESPAHVVIYSHWDGFNVLAKVHAGIARRWRWDDGGYLARIVAAHVWKGQEDKETGYGLDTLTADNGYPAVVVDVPTQRVSIHSYKGEGVFVGADKLKPELFGWSFEEFSTLDAAAVVERFSTECES